MRSTTDGETPLEPGVVRGSLPLAFSLVALGGIAGTLLAGSRFAASLTLLSLVAIVHLLWLERFLTIVLAGEAPRLRRRDGAKILGHFVLLAGVVVGAFLWLDFSPIGGAVGVTLVVIAIMVEGFRAHRPGGA